jgi:hypothetical protein
MTPRRSSGSSRADSGVEPTRSQNMTVSWRRSASDRTGVSGRAGASAASAAIASSRRRRCPTEAIPMLTRSSAVSRGNTCASTSFSRNIRSYCASPRPRSHAAMFNARLPMPVTAADVYLSANDAARILACGFLQPKLTRFLRKIQVLAEPVYARSLTCWGSGVAVSSICSRPNSYGPKQARWR